MHVLNFRMLDFMKRSLSPGFANHPGMVPYLLVLGLLAIAALGVLLWHGVYSWRHCASKWELLIGYVAPRLTCYGVFALYLGAWVSKQQDYMHAQVQNTFLAQKMLHRSVRNIVTLGRCV